MATSGENKIAGITVESAINKVDSSSGQQSVLAKWLQNRDGSIRPPKELIEKSPCICNRFETHSRNELPNSRPLSHRCPHHHTDCISDRSVEDQNRAKSAVNKQQTDKERKRIASAHCASNTGSVFSNEQTTSQEKSTGIPSRSSTNTKPEEKKSKIPIRIPEFTLSTSFKDKRVSSGNKTSKIPVSINVQHPISSRRNAAFENSTQITNDQENHESFDNSVQHDDDQKPAVALSVKEKMKTSTSANNYGCDLPLSNKEDNDFDQSQFNDGVDTNEFQENDTNEIDTLVSIGNNINNDNFDELKQRQKELKAYYDSFPNIDDATNETSSDIKKAKEFTESIFRNLPSGDVTDTNTVCHVLNKLLGNEYQGCLFYDSENGINLHDASTNLADIDSENRPFVLKLSSSEGLGNIKHVNTEQDELKLIQTLTNIIKQNQSHPVIEDITERLSKAHGVDKKSIIIKNVYVGTFNIVYTVMDLPIKAIKFFIKVEKKLKKQFKQFISLKIHPLLFRPSFDIAYFDKRGNKIFSSNSETHEVGPPGLTKLYTTPAGWTRNGLKVLNKYENDNWLHPFKDPGNWYRAFHGTGRAQSQDFGDKNQPCNPEYASVDALSSIYLNEFRKANVHFYGEGVYCSPNPKFPEEGFVRPVPLDTQKGKKTFKCMLQVAVNPNGVNFTANNDIWVVPDPKDIRPYGILIKEA